MLLMRVILVLLLPFMLLLQQGNSSTTTNACPPSSCGKISNISYPFRLQDDPKHCGESRYELSCENNVATLYLYSGKYYVQSINYNNFTIRVADPGVIEYNFNLLPHYSLSRSNFCDTYNNDENCTDPYHAGYRGQLYSSENKLFEHIVYLNCSHPVRNNPKYVNTSSCLTQESKSKGYYIYAIAGHITAEDLQVGCHVKFITPTSLKGLQGNQVISYDEIQKALVYGFEISWLRLPCQNYCEKSELCYFDTTTQKLGCNVHYCFTLMGFSESNNCGKDPPFELFLSLRYKFLVFSVNFDYSSTFI
ncbi:wall-associated receptor kinase galacturonan-binding protein [Medicago truncatula]|uniref:Wall-associated receptor kinase galacturonan-binding protein n=1 Tax=Medicago truncatula TaxID=3880 RepID=A0A072VQC7_MEDTR|nr:wall-associated receptor kinase galacturonan-binding protein [Medicago truncatula]